MAIYLRPVASDPAAILPSHQYLGLSIMNNLITTRWKTLPQDQRSGIRNFIVGVAIKISSTSDEDGSSSASSTSTPAATAYLHTSSLREKNAFMNKLNLIIVQILKQEWPNGTWPNAIDEIVTSSNSNLGLCENNMIILRLLSEEVFDYSAEQMSESGSVDHLDPTPQVGRAVAEHAPFPSQQHQQRSRHSRTSSAPSSTKSSRSAAKSSTRLPRCLC